MARLWCLLHLLCLATCTGQSQQPEDRVSCDTAAGINCQHEESISEQQALLQTNEARLTKVQKNSVEEPEENKTFSDIGEPVSAEPEEDDDEEDEGEDALLQEQAALAGIGKLESTDDALLQEEATLAGIEKPEVTDDAVFQEEATLAGIEKPEGTDDEPALAAMMEKVAEKVMAGEGEDALLQEQAVLAGIGKPESTDDAVLEKEATLAGLGKPEGTDDALLQEELTLAGIEKAVLQEEATLAGIEKPEGTDDEPAFSDMMEKVTEKVMAGEGGEALLQEDPSDEPIADIGEAVSEEGEDGLLEQDAEIVDPLFLEEDAWLQRVEETQGSRIPAINETKITDVYGNELFGEEETDDERNLNRKYADPAFIDDDKTRESD